MSSDSASSEVTYTSISSHRDSLAWAVDFFRLQEPDSPEAAPASPDYVPGPEEPEGTALARLPLSLGYVADSDPEEDSVDGPVDYPADGGNDDDDDSSDDDKEEEEASEEEDASEDEEEHLAPADSATPPSPPAWRTTTRISIRPEAPILLPPEEEVERLLALPTPPPSLSPPSAEERLASFITITTPVPAALPLPSPPLPPLPLPPLPPLPSSPLPLLPDSLFIPPVDRREDILEAELPPRKRLCLTTPTSRYEVGESSNAVPRPTRGRRVDYGFVGTLDAKARRQRAEAVGYGIRDTWVDPRETTEKVAPVILEGINTRVTELTAVQEQDTQEIYVVIEDTQDRQTQIYQTVETLVDDSRYHYETARLLDQEALVSREAWAYSMGFSSAVHYEL
ncbi:hypothetical protein Tco_0317379 [Tanacetum coccineum]